MEQENASTREDSTVTPMQKLGVPMFLLAMLAILFIGGSYSLRQSERREPMEPEEQQYTDNDQPIPLEQWKKPVVALALTGQMHGYVYPCGCSEPQYGGVIRRYNFLESLKAKGWDVVGIDLGELPQTKGIHEQSMLKFDLAMKSLGIMGYRGVGIGKDELLSPLGDALAHAFDNNPKVLPLSISLLEAAPKGKYHGMNARPYEIVDLGAKLPKIGVLSMMGSGMQKAYQEKEKFLDNQDELTKALKAFADARVEIGVILHHEYPDVKEPEGIDRDNAIEKQRKGWAHEWAKFCADERKRNPKVPPIQVMMILTQEPEPPSTMYRPDPNLPTQVVEIGHKGKYVGMLGLYRDARGKGFRMQYQIVMMGPTWETPEAKKKDHPVIKLMQQYNEQLMRQNMMDKLARAPHHNQLPASNEMGLKATFVGSIACKECHPAAFAIHAKSSHGKATQTLENLTFPSLRNHDPECMKCHVTGFMHPGGFNDFIALEDLAKWVPGQKNADPKGAAFVNHNQETRNVGCESCHGPGSEHVAKPGNKALRMLMNPYRPTDRERQLEDLLAKNPKDDKAKSEHQPLFQTRMQALSRFCTTCHDEENDVKWNTAGHEIAQKWIGNGIIHRTPKN